MFLPHNDVYLSPSLPLCLKALKECTQVRKKKGRKKERTLTEHLCARNCSKCFTSTHVLFLTKTSWCPLLLLFPFNKWIKWGAGVKYTICWIQPYVIPIVICLRTSENISLSTPGAFIVLNLEVKVTVLFPLWESLLLIQRLPRPENTGTFREPSTLPETKGRCDFGEMTSESPIWIQPSPISLYKVISFHGYMLICLKKKQQMILDVFSRAASCGSKQKRTDKEKLLKQATDSSLMSSRRKTVRIQGKKERSTLPSTNSWI